MAQWFLRKAYVNYFEPRSRLFSTLPIEKPELQNLTLPVNRSRSRTTQDHCLNKSKCVGVPNAKYQVSWKSVHRFMKENFGSVLPFIGLAAILVMFLNIHLLVPESLDTNLDKKFSGF